MKKILYVAGGIACISLIGFAYYAILPLFIHIKVDEALPTPSASQPQTQQESLPQVLVGAQVVGTVGHPASGTARIVEAGGKTYIRYEDFKTINGPDLYVYLAKDLNAEEFVDLGRLRATEGNVNYEIPAGVGVSEDRYALVWCKAFGVLFNSADLSKAQ